MYVDGDDINGVFRIHISPWGRFAQERSIYWALRARAVSLWGASRKNGYIIGGFAQKWSEKSLIEGGTGIRGAEHLGCALLLQWVIFPTIFVRSAPFFTVFARSSP